MGNNILSARFRDSIPGSRSEGGTTLFTTKHAEVIARGGRFFNDVINRSATFGARPSSRFSYNAYELPQLLIDFEDRPSKEAVADAVMRLLDLKTVKLGPTEKQLKERSDYNDEAKRWEGMLGEPVDIIDPVSGEKLNWWMPKLKLISMNVKAAYPNKG